MKYNEYYSIYAGQVSDNQDPQNSFRLKVIVPEIFGKGSSDWALPSVPNGQGYGIFALPQVGDNVWVQFRNGDARYPVWSYGAIAKGEKPNEAEGQSIAIISKAGNKIVIDENGKIKIANKDGYTLKELMTELFDWLENSQVLTPAGLGKFAPDSLAQLQPIKSKINELLQ